MIDNRIRWRYRDSLTPSSRASIVSSFSKRAEKLRVSAGKINKCAENFSKRAEVFVVGSSSLSKCAEIATLSRHDFSRYAEFRGSQGQNLSIFAENFSTLADTLCTHVKVFSTCASAQ
ncbi:MAG TPA: hypothetical protein VI670_07885 [Thermoanaerobaculia bacterium]